jgi:glycosyltransferase involved in cell wall biosynthesis
LEYYVGMAKPKKHIVIDARIRPASSGRPVARLLEHLQEIDNQHRYTVLVKSDDHWQPTSKNFTVVPSRFSLFSFNPLNQVLFAWQLYRLKPDLTYFMMSPGSPLFFFGRQLTLTHDLTMFKFVRAGSMPLWLHRLRMYGYRFLMWQTHRKAQHVVVPTDYVNDAVCKRYLFVNRKITTILEASEPPLSGRPSTPEHAPDDFIMYTGSAFPHKNLERLVSAFSLLREQHENLKLVLVGKREWHSKRLQAWAKKNTPYFDDIVFTGFVPDEELKWYYEHARAYVFPSLSEGFGLPGLEAMVHGCPVVSSNFTCLPEVHGDAAHYFNPEDVSEMAQKIDEVISNDKLRQKLIAKGYENAKRFSWRRFASQHLALFEKLLEK